MTEQLSMHTHIAEGMRELSSVFFIRALIPFMRPHPRDLITSPNPHFQYKHIGDWCFNVRIFSFIYLFLINLYGKNQHVNFERTQSVTIPMGLGWFVTQYHITKAEVKGQNIQGECDC